jgi:hypothetical protein
MRKKIEDVALGSYLVWVVSLSDLNPMRLWEPYLVVMNAIPPGLILMSILLLPVVYFCTKWTHEHPAQR